MDNNKNIQSILRDALEKEIPSSQVNLLPAIKSSLVAGKIIGQGEPMNTIKPRRIPRAAFVTLIIIILLALALITPPGRAFAQNILRFFIRTESDAIPVPTSEPVNWVDLTPGVPSATMTPPPPMAVFARECGDFGSATCTVEQIRSKVDFTVKEPGDIPEGLYYDGATGGPDSIYLLYYYENQSGSLSVTMERWTGDPSPQTGLIGASATVEKVQIGNLTGEYFKGSFVYNDGETVAKWDPNFGLETLRWVEDGISYTMQYSYPPKVLGKEGMVALAESMTTEPVSKLPIPVATEDPYLWDPKEYWNLSTHEAELQAGFKLILPAKMPEILSLVGANYDAKVNVVGVYYRLELPGMPPNSDGLVLRQQVAPNPSDCALCDILVGDYNTLEGNTDYKVITPLETNIETVQIGAMTGKYVEGNWHGTDCCGWEWASDPYSKFLRWWVDGRAFELSYMGMDIEKADMIKIAESIK
jgi:hypothetical protein